MRNTQTFTLYTINLSTTGIHAILPVSIHFMGIRCHVKQFHAIFTNYTWNVSHLVCTFVLKWLKTSTRMNWMQTKPNWVV